MPNYKYDRRTTQEGATGQGHLKDWGKTRKKKSGQSVSRLGFKLGTIRMGARLIVGVTNVIDMQQHRKLRVSKEHFGKIFVLLQ
jgi:hypothetical protein